MADLETVHATIDHSGITGAGGSVATDAIWDAAGDLAVGSGANTAAKLTKGSDGDVLTMAAGAVTWAAPSGSAGAELDYVEFTSNVSPTATSEATANTVVTGSAVAYDGSTVVMVEFFSPSARPDAAAAGRNMSFWLYEDGSSIGLLAQISTPAAAGNVQTIEIKRRMTPSNASHTYSIRASVSAGTGLVGAGAGGAGNTMPGYIRITEV